MFISDPSHKHGMFSSFLGNGSTYWRAVTVASNRPWFLATLESLANCDGDHHAGGSGIYQSMLVGDIADVLSLFEPESKSLTAVRSVDVLLPQYVGEYLGWHMEKVVAVWQPTAEMCEGSGLVADYVVETSDGLLHPTHPSGDWFPKKSELALVWTAES